MKASPILKFKLSNIFRVCVLGLMMSSLAGCGSAPKRISVGSHSRPCDRCDDRIQIGLYHALAEIPQDAGRFYAQIRAAGFSFVHLWEGQDIEAALRGLKQTGLRAVIHFPNDDLVRAKRNDPLVLGWYLNEEPSHLLSEEASLEALRTFNQRRVQIQDIDPGHRIFVIDGPHTSKVDYAWRQWAVTGDISAHFNYPVTVRKIHTSTLVQRVGETVSLARELNQDGKPVWFVVQAFGGHDRGWLMPTPAQYRAMVYSAVVHGATGIIVFAYDSFVTRDDGIIGVRPDPRTTYLNQIDYNHDGEPPLVASPDELEASRHLWDAVVDVNAELKALSPWVLSPTDATLPLDVAVRHGRGRDVNYIVKNKNGHRVLILQNTGTTDITLQVSRPGAELNLKPFFKRDDDIKKAVGGDGWQVHLGAYAIAVVNVEMQMGIGH